MRPGRPERFQPSRSQKRSVRRQVISMAGAALSGAVWFGFTNPERDKDDMLQPDDGWDQPFVQVLNTAAPVDPQARVNESPH